MLIVLIFAGSHMTTMSIEIKKRLHVITLSSLPGYATPSENPTATLPFE